MRAVLIFAAAVAAAMGGAASAATYSFSLSGADFNGSGSITTSDVGETNLYPCATCVTGLGYLMTGISGTINGDSITGVAGLNTIAGNNNKLYQTAPYVDWGDLGFTTAAHSFNVFNGDYYGRPGDYIAIDGGSLFANAVQFSIDAAAPVPEPGIVAMMATGLLVVGGAARRGRRARHG